MNIEQLQYPIGKFAKPAIITAAHLAQYRNTLETFPEALQKTVASLSDSQLDTPYRPDGWTIRQVVHHCADSHLNSFIRFKLALTEENPTIKPYFEDRWAVLADSMMPVEISLQLVDLLHKKWIVFLKSMQPADFERTFFHPEQKKSITLAEATGIYAWHSEHHLAQITNLLIRQGWA
ncbi:MAG TPA: putative metal-dependent hydrolase [Microscillaceae bacterium]|nr:putative metal-dependent hydrolase [Microscillaceae bacterium]